MFTCRSDRLSPMTSRVSREACSEKKSSCEEEHGTGVGAGHQARARDEAGRSGKSVWVRGGDVHTGEEVGVSRLGLGLAVGRDRRVRRAASLKQKASSLVLSVLSRAAACAEGVVDPRNEGREWVCALQ